MAMPNATRPTLTRCAWSSGNPLYQHYHDEEWGVPCLDDDILFEFLILEGAQAGLSWITILKKRDNYRHAFARFNAQKVARFNQRSVARLMADPGIVRNRLKIQAAISNAGLFLDLKDNYGSFANYLWGFIDGKAIQNHWRTPAEIPATTDISDTISKDMKKRGFRFFGSTICYAHMQATGMVNDHLVGCFRHRECAELSPKILAC
jgi:DNA-3-methyladenine glycosylase I